MAGNLTSNRNPPESGPHLTSAGPRDVCEEIIPYHNDSPRKRRKFTSAVGRLWAAIIHPKIVLEKHLDGKRSLRWLIFRTGRKSSPSVERPCSSPEATKVAVPARPTHPCKSIAAEDKGTQTWGPPDPPSVITITTDSSISLSPEPNVTTNATPVPDPPDQVDVVDTFDHGVPCDGRPNKPLSQATTVPNSTSLAENFSNHTSGVPSAPISEPGNGDAIAASIETPFESLQHISPSTLRLQTNMDLLHVHIEGEEGYSSGREGTSSPASAVDFHGMGGHFDAWPVG